MNEQKHEQEYGQKYGQELKRSRYDAVVVGARVAGASTAMLLARAGLRVLAIERSAYGSDILSTHALMRAGVTQLHRWGVLDRITAAGTPPIRKTTFHYDTEKIELLIKERDGVDALYAPRRTVLDAALVDAARSSGAEVLHHATVARLLDGASGRVRGLELVDSAGRMHRVEAGIVIGADGVRSKVAQAVGAEVQREGRNAAAVIYGYRRGLDLNDTHWHYSRNVAAGAIPTNDGAACVFVALRPERYLARLRGGLDRLYNEALSEVDAQLAARMADAEPTGKLYPFAGRRGFIRRSWGLGWALIGDAACFKDPITAHGITDALRDAEMLSNAVIEGTNSALAAYQHKRDEFAVELLDLSDEIASFDWDFDRLKELHLQLSKLMTRECDLVRSFEGAMDAAMCG